MPPRSRAQQPQPQPGERSEGEVRVVGRRMSREELPPGRLNQPTEVPADPRPTRRSQAEARVERMRGQLRQVERQEVEIPDDEDDEMLRPPTVEEPLAAPVAHRTPGALTQRLIDEGALPPVAVDVATSDLEFNPLELLSDALMFALRLRLTGESDETGSWAEFDELALGALATAHGVEMDPLETLPPVARFLWGVSGLLREERPIDPEELGDDVLNLGRPVD